MDPWPGRLLTENPVDVVVAWDNLSANGSLAGTTVEPRVPTMGQAADYGLVPTPFTSPPDPDGKNAGFNRWKDAGVATYQVNVRGGTHYEWSRLPGFPTSSWDWGNAMADHYTLAWLDRWLKTPCERGYATADARLLEDADWTDRMSFYFRSVRAYETQGGSLEECADIKAGCSPASDQAALAVARDEAGLGTVTLTGNGAPLEGQAITLCGVSGPVGELVTDASGSASFEQSDVTGAVFGGSSGWLGAEATLD
jgi:hypothetical protein